MAVRPLAADRSVCGDGREPAPLNECDGWLHPLRRTATPSPTCTTTGTRTSATSTPPSTSSPSSPAEFAPLPVLELGVGTGRLAIPLAARGFQVVGLDASAAMLAKLAEKDPAGSVDRVGSATWSTTCPTARSLSSSSPSTRSSACSPRSVSKPASPRSPSGWRPAAAFVIEAFVPEPQAGPPVVVRSMTTDSVVLSVTHARRGGPDAQGQYVSISESGGVRMRPWAIRYATTDQLDAMARASGFRLAERWEDARRAPFTAESARHVVRVSHNSQPRPS